MRAALVDKVFAILHRHRTSGDPARAQRAKRQMIALCYGAGLRKLHEIARLTPAQGTFLDLVTAGSLYGPSNQVLINGGRQQGKSWAQKFLSDQQTDIAPPRQKPS